MLDLNSDAWQHLHHAYGAATDTPALLQQLETVADLRDYRSEPWHSLWSSLCHQGDVYPASFAAVPHLVAAAVQRPASSRKHFLLLVASIEQARNQRHVQIQEEMQVDYSEALGQASALTIECLSSKWDENDYRGLLASLAVLQQHFRLGSVLFDMEEALVCPHCEHSLAE